MPTCEVCGRDVREGLRFCGGQWPCWKVGLGLMPRGQCLWAYKDYRRDQGDDPTLCLLPEGHDGEHSDGTVYHETMKHHRPAPGRWWDHRDYLSEELEHLQEVLRCG